MASKRLQHEWKVVNTSHPSHGVFYKQYNLQYEQCLQDHPNALNTPDENGILPTISLSPDIATVFPNQDIILFPTNVALTTWTAYLSGPEKSVYDSFRFELRIEIPQDYPHSAPKVGFLTPIFHPNIDFNTGEICLDTLKENWTPTWTLETTMRAIYLLLSQPEHSSPLNIDAANILRRQDNRGYWSIARMYTIKYGIPLQQQLQQQRLQLQQSKQINVDENNNNNNDHEESNNNTNEIQIDDHTTTTTTTTTITTNSTTTPTDDATTSTTTTTTLSTDMNDIDSETKEQPIQQPESNQDVNNTDQLVE